MEEKSILQKLLKICNTKALKNTLKCAFWSGRTEYNILKLCLEWNIMNKNLDQISEALIAINVGMTF